MERDNSNTLYTYIKLSELFNKGHCVTLKGDSGLGWFYLALTHEAAPSCVSFV